MYNPQTFNTLIVLLYWRQESKWWFFCTGAGYFHSASQSKVLALPGMFNEHCSWNFYQKHFRHFGQQIHEWGWLEKGPLWTKNGQTWQACQRSKVVQRGPKGTKMISKGVFDHLWPIRDHMDPFGPFWVTISFLLQKFPLRQFKLEMFCFVKLSISLPVFVSFLSLDEVTWRLTFSLFLIYF